MEITVPHLATLPASRAADSPEHRAIDDDHLGLNNAEFAVRVDAAAAFLAEQGIGAGDVVATILANRVELVIAMFAAWRVGAALTPVNPGLTPAEASYQLDDAGTKLVIHQGAETSGEVPTCDGAIMVSVDDVPAAHAGGAELPEVAADLDALALLIYTSGTTGKPKGVEMDHANLVAMVQMIIDSVTLDDTDHCLLILPLFHVNAIVVSVLSPLATGGSTSITGRFSPATFFDTIEAVRPTFFSAVPAIYQLLNALPDDVDPDTSSVRFAICGAAPMPAEAIARFEDRYGIVLIEGYGLSEGTCASTINPPEGPRKPGTVGKALPGQKVMLLGDDGQPTTEGRGEIIIQGPNVMRGYLGKPEETAETLVDGWLRTGDVGVFDDDGYLKIVDRVKDMIIRGGENIYPKEIENALYTHDDVVEAAVVGRPDEVMGEEPVAYVSLREGSTVTEADLIDLCAAELAKYKVPKSVTVLDELPKNPVGKIAKPVLRDRVTSA